MKKITRGNIYLIDFGTHYGSEQGGVRPGIIIQNDLGNYHSTTTLVIPISSSNPSRCLPTHVFMNEKVLVQGELKGKAMVEQMRVVDKNRIQKKIGQINERGMIKLHNAMLVATGFEKSYQTNQIVS